MRRDDQRNVNHRYVLILTELSGTNIEMQLNKIGGCCRRRVEVLEGALRKWCEITDEL